MRRATAVTIMAALASLLLGGADAAFASGAHAKASLFGESQGCGNVGTHAVGAVTLKRINLGPVTVKVKLKEGEPNTTYVVGLFGNHCVLEQDAGLEFTTNKKGVGKVSGMFSVGEEENEFAVAVEPKGNITGPTDVTPLVMLP